MKMVETNERNRPFRHEFLPENYLTVGVANSMKQKLGLV